MSLRDIRAVYDPEMHIAMLQDSSRHHFYAKCLLKHQEDLKDKVLQSETRTGLYFWTSVVSLVAAFCCIYRTSHHQPTAPECIFPGRLWCHMCHSTWCRWRLTWGLALESCLRWPWCMASWAKSMRWRRLGVSHAMWPVMVCCSCRCATQVLPEVARIIPKVLESILDAEDCGLSVFFIVFPDFDHIRLLRTNH